MAYLLLWSAIERYVSLRYHLGGDVYAKVKMLAKEEAFAASLREQVTERRILYRADRPGERVDLDASRPDRSLGYYYQVRSNITHRGKAAVRDFDTLRFSLEELNNIFGTCWMQRLGKPKMATNKTRGTDLDPGFFIRHGARSLAKRSAQ